MCKFLLLRFDAPLMSFGAPAVDEIRDTMMSFPATSMLAGLLANALGYNHEEVQKIHLLQDRIRFAVKCEREGEVIEDFQTVDLEADYMAEGLAWTTWGKVIKRAGGAAKKTIVRKRRYLADAVFLIAITLEPGDKNPTIEEVAQRIQKPVRPLFIGRKSCLPAGPMFAGVVEAADFEDALSSAKPIEERRRKPLRVCWRLSITPEGPIPEYIRPVCDRRDFENQVHVGQRFMVGFSLKRNDT